MEFNENEIEDYYIDLIVNSGIGFSVVRPVPFGSFIGEDEIKEWTTTTPFMFVAVGAENYHPISGSHQIYAVDPVLVLIFGAAYTTSDTAYRELRDKAKSLRHLIAGQSWYTAEDSNGKTQPIVPVLESQSLHIRDARIGIIAYKQDYIIKTLRDTPQ